MFLLADNDGRPAVYAEKHIGLAKMQAGLLDTIGPVWFRVIIDGKMLSNRFLQFGTQAGHLIQSAWATCFADG
jgi:hypothetical protein